MKRGRKRRRRRRRGQPPLNQVQAWTQARLAGRRLPPGIFSIPSVRTLCEAKTWPRARHSKPPRLTKTTSYTAGLGNDGGGRVCVWVVGGWVPPRGGGRNVLLQKGASLCPPRMQKGFQRLQGGPGRVGPGRQPPGLLKKESPPSHTPVSPHSLSLLEPRSLRPEQLVLPLVQDGLFKKTKTGELTCLPRPLAWRQRARQDDL